MSDTQATPQYHEDASRFRAALRLAEANTEFRADLIEKDYYCSIVLRDLEGLFRSGLVFKGGTSLSKVHTEFFRLSEDLDFSVSISPTAKLSARRKAAEPFKSHFADIQTRLLCVRVAEPIEGANVSRHYKAKLAYRSALTGKDEYLKVELGLREELLLPALDLPARTLLQDPSTNLPVIHPFYVRALVLQEAYAEKVRAALTRREPAIRDFFDVDHAVQNGLLHHLDPSFLRLVMQKLAMTADPVDTSAAKVDSLKAQLDAHLKPVLRMRDYEAFLLDRAFAMLEAVAVGCKKG